MAASYEIVILRKKYGILTESVWIGFLPSAEVISGFLPDFAANG